MSEGTKRIYLSPPHKGGNEQEYIKEAFNSNWIAPLGYNVDSFEIALANFCGVNHALALSSGTAAIHLALILLGIKSGDEVIASTFSFSATVNFIVYLGAIPIFVDSEPDTWNLDPDLLEKAIDDRKIAGPGPKAIIVVHLYGMPANMARIMEIAERYGIPIIEDAAESLGSMYNGKQTGTFGRLGVISFNGNKIITTSGGGALISEDKELIDEARFLATQARDDAPHYQHYQIGYNYRMSNILAGIGRGQLEVMEDRVKRRRDNYFFYKKALEKYDGIKFQEEPDKSYFSNHWLTTILLDPIKTGLSPEILQKEMEKNNIETRPFWKPLHLQPVFESCKAYINGVSDSFFANGLCLPSGTNMSDEDRGGILNLIIKNLHK